MPGWNPTMPQAARRLCRVAGMAGATIKIFLANGTPLGLRVLEKSNCTRRGFDVARADWPKVRSREDVRAIQEAAAG